MDDARRNRIANLNPLAQQLGAGSIIRPDPGVLSLSAAQAKLRRR